MGWLEVAEAATWTGELNVEPGAGEARTHVAPDGARAEDGEPHRWRPFSREATRLRCILPVGVRGISSTT